MSSVLSGNIFNIAKLDQTIGQIKNIVTFVKKKKNNIFDFDLLYILKFKKQFWKKKL